jgi:hypothetical protein
MARAIPCGRRIEVDAYRAEVVDFVVSRSRPSATASPTP